MEPAGQSPAAEWSAPGWTRIATPVTSVTYFANIHVGLDSTKNISVYVL